MREQVYGLFLALYIRVAERKVIRRVLMELYHQALESKPAKRRQFVMYVGFSKSGKTTTLNQSEEANYARVESMSIHQGLNQALLILRDGYTSDGSAYWARQYLTEWLRVKLLRRLCRQGYNIVQDSCNLSQRERRERLAIPHSYGYTTTIVHVTCSEEILLDRLQEADEAKKALNEEPTWIKLYLDKQLQRYDEPQECEADVFVSIATG